MNKRFKAVLLTIVALSLLIIAFFEIRSYVKKEVMRPGSHAGQTKTEEEQRHAKALAMPKTQIEFDETKHSFGTIKEGQKVRHAFKFTNTGAAPLLISKAVASCGCTVPSFPKEPVLPGQGGEVILEFNSNNRVGHQIKNVMIWSNAQLEKMSIGFEADVVE